MAYLPSEGTPIAEAPAEPRVEVVQEVPPPPEPETKPEEVLPVVPSPKCLETEIRGSCWLFVKSKVPELPKWEIIQALPKHKTPQAGDVAVFHYKNGLDHVALVIATTSITATVDECNYSACECGKRTVLLTDPSLRGFLTP